MRYLYKLMLIFLIASCNQTGPGKPDKDSIAMHKTKDTHNFEKNVSIPQENYDKTLINFSTEILKYLKTRDYNNLSGFIHPEFGIRFSPYAYIDTINDQLLSKKDLKILSENQQKVKWGIYDGSGKPIYLSVGEYFEKFVYDADFLNAEKKSVNKIIGSGNSLNNLAAVYAGCDFTEFYFSGFDPKYEGMDWTTLRLVFKRINNKPYLVAIIHDQWTI